MANTEKEILRFERDGKGEFIVVKEGEDKKGRYVDIRTYYTDEDSGNTLPTKKGVRFSIDDETNLDSLISSLTSLKV